ncbi:MAG TPA: hypothetical protein VF060_26065 [Trebonia sp.]
MPKSRKRQSRLMRKIRGTSGDPRKRSPERIPEQVLLASAILQKAAAVKLSGPLPFAALPPLAQHTIRSRFQEALPPERCVDDCLVLAHAYAELGIEAQVRVAELTVTDVTTSARTAHGTAGAHWEDGVFSGHTVVWLPAHRHLIDPAAEQFKEIAVYKAGPVIAAAGPARADGTGADEDEVKVTVARGYLRLGYVLGSRAASAEALDHPSVRAEWDANRRRGVNVASEVVWLLANERTPTDTAVIPYPRAAALIDGARRVDRHGSLGEDFFFRQRGADPSQARPIRLHEIPLPSGTPAPAAVS